MKPTMSTFTLSTNEEDGNDNNNKIALPGMTRKGNDDESMDTPPTFEKKLTNTQDEGHY